MRVQLILVQTETDEDNMCLLQARDGGKWYGKQNANFWFYFLIAQLFSFSETPFTEL